MFEFGCLCVEVPVEDNDSPSKDLVSGPLMFNRVHTCFVETHTHKKKETESFCSQLPPFKAQSTDLLCQRDLVMLYEMPLLLSPAGVLRLQFSVLCFER